MECLRLEALPEDTIVEVLEHLSLHELQQLLPKVSRKIKRIVETRVRRVKTYESTIKIPALTTFGALTILEGAALDVRGGDEDMLKQLLHLRKAHISYDLVDESKLRRLFAELNRSKDQDWKIAIRYYEPVLVRGTRYYATRSDAVFIRGFRYYTWTAEDLDAYLDELGLTKVKYRHTPLPDAFVDFVKNADFGPVDPSRPVSDDNPTIGDAIGNVVYPDMHPNVAQVLLSAFMYIEDEEYRDETIDHYFKVFLEDRRTEDDIPDPSDVDNLYYTSPHIELFAYYTLPLHDTTPEQVDMVTSVCREVHRNYHLDRLGVVLDA